MHNVTDLADTVAALVDGWGERVEYAIRTTTPTGATRIEQRAETRTQPPLLDQLASHHAPRRTGQRTRHTGKNGSRPPMSLDAEALLARITAVVHEAHRVLAARAGETARPGTVREQLRHLVGLAAVVEPDYPTTVAGVLRVLRSLIRQARILLDYDPRPRVLRDRHCAECGGRLIMDEDAMRAWCIGVGVVEGPVEDGQVGPVRYGSCGASYGRSLWLAHFHQEAS